MSGGSRGIGLAIAVRAAQDGANITLIAKTDQPHPRLPGTIHSAAEEIEAAGGRALPIVGDIRDDELLIEAVRRTADTFGGIDICVNNASAIDLSRSEQLAMRRYDLMQDVNARGTFLLSRSCLPHLRDAPNPHILTLSPPISLEPRWAGAHLGYTIAKYGMSLCTLGFAEEHRGVGIAANSLWPRTTVATAALVNILGGEGAISRSRTPRIMSDAAHVILTSPSRELTGQLLIDEDVLRAAGVTDFSAYREGGWEEDLDIDFFLDGCVLPEPT